MRYDLTDWIIHFVRERDSEKDFACGDDQNVSLFTNGELDQDADAFSVLKTIIRLGGLTPGYSFRSGRTTIYGGTPAVCATEMPIYSFSVYARQRAEAGNVSSYGIAFLKSEFCAAGGRPVIYGLSTDDVSYQINDPYCRILAPHVIPVHEQYRYVAYNPSPNSWIDWSHEREWRWKVRSEEHDSLWAKDGDGCYGPIPGLPLFRGKSNHACFSQLRIIVWHKSEAEEIQELLTGLYLAKSNNYDTPFSRSVISNTRIIVLDDVVTAVEVDGKIKAQTIEGLEAANLVQPIVIHDPPPDAKEMVELAMEKAGKAAEAAAAEFIAKHSEDKGSCGFASAVTYDVTNPLVQYMLSSGLVSGPFDGRVHIKIGGHWSFGQSIDYNEAIHDAAAKSLASTLGISIFMESRLD